MSPKETKSYFMAPFYHGNLAYWGKIRILPPMVILEVKSRDGSESPEILRARGIVPAIFYGPKEKATSISVDAQKLERVWRDAGETTIVKLTGVGEEHDALFHDVQIHPTTGKLLHADFYVIEKGKKIKLKVPIEFTGVAPAEKAGHIVVKTLHEVEIEVTPQELPHNLPVDLSKLENVGDHITAARITLPASAVLVTLPEEIVVSVKAFVEEKVEVAPAPETVITTGAKPEEGATATAPGEAPAKAEKAPDADKKDK